jgi:hypothetical protein
MSLIRQTNRANVSVSINLPFRRVCLVYRTGIIVCLTALAACSGGDAPKTRTAFEAVAATPTCIAHSDDAILQPQDTNLDMQSQSELLKLALTDGVYQGPLFYPPIQTLDDIRQRNSSIFVSNEAFASAYECLVAHAPVEMITGDPSRRIYRLDFGYQGRSHSAFFYASGTAACSAGRSAALIIPGSGINQSSAIVGLDRSNYHFGVLDSLRDVNDIYIYIKPNEDYLAFHDGKGKKANLDSIVNWHLNRGGSFSSSYIIQSLAVMRWLNSCYSHRTAIVGLSQGGAAALFNAFQSKPKVAIIAAGASVIFDDLELSGHNQLIGVPGYAEQLQRIDGLKRNIQSSASTNFLFTYGLSDTDYYKIEAVNGTTAAALYGVANFQTAIHPFGHSFPSSEVQRFIRERL